MKKQSLPSFPLILIAGKTPVIWQRELRRSHERLDFLWRGCVWMEAIANIDLTLCNEPLLGNSLIALTESWTVSTETKSEVSLKHAQQFNFPKISPSPKVSAVKPVVSRHRVVPEEPLFHYSIATVFQQPPQVSVQMLSRLAGGRWGDGEMGRWGEKETRGDGCGGQGRFLSFEGGEFGVMGGLEKSNNRLFAASFNQEKVSDAIAFGFANQTVSQEWLEGLVRRIQRTLTQENSLAIVNKTSVSDNDLFSGGETLTLVDQWSLPLNGQTADLELLTRIAQNYNLGDVKTARSVSNQTSNKRSSELLTTSKIDKNQTIQTPAPAQHKTEFIAPINKGVFEQTNNSVELLTQNPPPAIMPSLPPLVPQQLVNLPGQSVASAIIRQEATQEEAATREDDLNVLAAKIKRILDEEARRYGIDV
ncbi:MAG: hypothetical protein ACHBN1_07600 [Heteroscytonema crispum UTEX LB 1556]